ncbi:hypothetical protein AAIE21_01060 [Paenibacillus sp. 102]|uniref:hypothetical protein n=1 Tax=Paenibacillus sp. 102 TaxID=3120823 RepID=UPI0031BB7994
MIESAFRANKNDDSTQTISANTSETITFETELFDLGNEYNNVDSFIPNQDGIYSIATNVLFLPDIQATYTAQLGIEVNGITIAVDIKTTPDDPFPLTLPTTFELSTIYGLHATDVVTVSFFSLVSGTIFQSSGVQINHFTAARFPFTSPVPFAFTQSSPILSRIVQNTANTTSSILPKKTPL